MCNWLSGGVQIPNPPFHVKPRGIPNSSAIKKEKVLVALHRLGSSEAPAVCTGRKLTYEERVWIKMSTLLSISHEGGWELSTELLQLSIELWCLSQPALLEPKYHPLWAVLSPKLTSFLCEMKLTHLLNHAAVRIKVDVSCEPAKRDCYLVSPQQKLPSNHAVSMARKCWEPGSCVPGDRPSMWSQERFPRKWHLK